jgi:hypothetical protein
MAVSTAIASVMTDQRARRFFERRLNRVMQTRGLSGSDAERAAYEAVLVAHLNATFPRNCDPNFCVHCRRSEDPAAPLIPLGVGPHAWLHRDCADPWRERRRAIAVAELAAMGITTS